MPTPTVLSYTIQDNDGVKASTPLYTIYDGAVETVDALIGTWLEAGGMIDAITGGVIRQGAITIPLAPDASWKDTPLVGQSVSDTLNLQMGNVDNIRAWTAVIPALRDTLVDSQGKPIVVTGNAIALFRDLLIDGFTNGSYSNDQGDDLDRIIAYFQGVRKHRRQLRARSTVIG
jgi:hypothetical protein